MEKESRNDLSVIVRSANENTEDLCVSLVSDQIDKERIQVIHEVPFSKAVQKTYEIGLDYDLEWTLAIDADILITENAISEMVSHAENLDDSFFLYQGRVLDKFFCASRPGGPHLYRTKHLKVAYEQLEKVKDDIRPESSINAVMTNSGLHNFQDIKDYGIHDFYQSPSDIYRKAFLHANKHKKYIPYFLKEWYTRCRNDQDYLIALQGLLDGNSADEIKVDSDFFSDKKPGDLFIVNWGTNNSITEFTNTYNILRNFKKSKDSIKLEKEKFSNISRSDKRLPLFQWYLSETFLRLGKKLRTKRK